MDGISYTIPHLCAGGWLSVISRPDWTARVLQLADPDSYESFLQRAEAGEYGQAEINRLARSVLSEASGRTWWEAERLIAQLRHDPLLGAVLSTGADPSRLTLAAFLSVIYAVLVRGADHRARTQIEAELTIPPPEAAGEGPEEDMSAMVSRMRAMPGVSTG